MNKTQIKLKLATDALWLALQALNQIQIQADSNHELGNDTQYAIQTILDKNEGILDHELAEIATINDFDFFDSTLYSRFTEVFRFEF